METLTVEKARELLQRAVAEKGADYVYPQGEQQRPGVCSYFHNGAPSCIVGHVLSYMGFEAATLEPLEGLVAENVLVDLRVPCTSTTVLGALGRTQRAQDGSETWGQALEAFEDCLAEDQ